MKNLIIALLVLAAAGLGAFSIHQRNQLGKIKGDMIALEEQLKSAQEELERRAEADRRIVFEQERAKALQETLKAASAQAAKTSEEVIALKQSLAAAETNSQGGLANLLKNPEMREMIKQQQKMVLGPMIDKMYADLFKELNFTPEQAAQVKELLQKKMMTGAELGMSLLDGGADAAKRDEIRKEIKNQNDAIDEELRQLLGDENFRQFKEYERGTGDRMAVSLFRDHMAGNSAGALSPAQERQLIDAMQQQSRDFKWTTSPSEYETPGNTDFAELFSSERLDKLAEEKALYDQQMLARARNFLTPQQYAEYEKFLENQRQMQISAMRMAQTMFGNRR